MSPGIIFRMDLTKEPYHPVVGRMMHLLLYRTLYLYSVVLQNVGSEMKPVDSSDGYVTVCVLGLLGL